MKEHHKNRDGLLSRIRDLVFGLEDSLVSTLGVVIGMAAGTDDRAVVILSGLVLVAVEAISMAAGSFLSSKSHRQMLERAIREEEQEIEEEPEKEIEELRGMYRVRGFSPEEVEILVKRITSDKKLWLEEMISKELHIGLGELETPKENAFVMLLSYLAGGMVSVVPYFFLSLQAASITAVVLTLIALFGLGFAKGKLTSTNPARSGAEMLLIAGTATFLGFVIGKAASSFFGIEVR
jgi:predicted membrane protein (TIGR00267 family)